MSHPQEIPNFGALIDRTLRIIKQQFLQVFKDLDLDVTTEQWVLIDLLAKNDGVSQTDLAGSSFKNAPTTSRIIELLRKKGLINKQQSEEDKRQYLIFLSEKGKALHKRAYPKVVEFRNKGWEGLTLEDYQTLELVMNKVFDNFSKG